MSCDQQTFDVNAFLGGVLTTLRPLLLDLATEALEEPRRRLGELRSDVQRAIDQRAVQLSRLKHAKHEEWSPGTSRYEAEIARLRTIEASLPFAGVEALIVVLGAVRVDGRPDYMEIDTSGCSCCSVLLPPPVGTEVKEPSTEDRIKQEVAWARAAVDSFPHEVATVWVGRPAVEAAKEAIESTGRKVEARRSHGGGEWSVRDLLIVQPPAPKAEDAEEAARVA